MKKLMLTLVVAALSGSSLFGVHARGPEDRLAKPYVNGRTQPSGTTAFMDPALSKCLQRKEYTTSEEAQQALAECQKEIYQDNGEVSIGSGEGGLYW